MIKLSRQARDSRTETLNKEAFCPQAIVEMSDVMSIERVLMARSGTTAGNTQLIINRFKDSLAAKSDGAMKGVKAKGLWGHVRKVHALGTQRYTKSMLSAIVTLGGGEITVPEIRKVGVTDLSDPKVQKVVPDLKCSVEINPSTGHKTVSLRSSVRLQVRRLG
eukprot:COSAG06_NODE_858_length_11909_cov_6.018036_8_plen_163_part_00